MFALQGAGFSPDSTCGDTFAYHINYRAAFPALAAAPCTGLMLFLVSERFMPAPAAVFGCGASLLREPQHMRAQERKGSALLWAAFFGIIRELRGRSDLRQPDSAPCPWRRVRPC